MNTPLQFLADTSFVYKTPVFLYLKIKEMLSIFSTMYKISHC